VSHILVQLRVVYLKATAVHIAKGPSSDQVAFLEIEALVLDRESPYFLFFFIFAVSIQKHNTGIPRAPPDIDRTTALSL